MSFENNSSTFALEMLRPVGTGQAVVECKLRAESSSEIAKVLSVTASAHIYNVECMSEEARYSGRVVFKAIYGTAEGHTAYIEYVAEFTDKISDKRLTPHVRAFAQCSVSDIDTISVSPSEIKLAAVVEIELKGVMTEEVKFADKMPENLIIKREMTSAHSLCASVQDTFKLSNDIEINDNVHAVVSLEGEAFIESVEAFEGGIKAQGNVYLQVCYIKSIDAIPMQSQRFVLPFTQEIAASGLNKDCMVGAVAKIVENKTLAINVSSDSESVISLENVVCINAFAYENKQFSVITDAFSLTNKLNMNTESFTNLRYSTSKYYSEKIEGEITLNGNLPLADKIIAVTGTSVQMANSYCEDGGFVVEGIAHAGVIYYNEQQNMQNAVQIELPFSLKVNVPSLTSKHILEISVGISEVMAKTKRGNLITVSLELKLAAHFFIEVTDLVLKDITEGEPIEINEYAIGVYLVRAGQTLWDIAKAARVTPEQIALQNPNLPETLLDGQRIAVYRQITKKK